MKYRITTESGIFLNDRFIYKGTAVQDWDIQLFGGIMMPYSYSKGYRLLITCCNNPHTDFTGYNFFDQLSELLNKPSEKLEIILNSELNYLTVKNQDEILSVWNETKEQIVDNFGTGEDIVAVMEEREMALKNISDEMMDSLLHHICILSFGKRKKSQMNIPSVLSIENQVLVEPIRMNGKQENPVIYTGEGRLRDKSQAKKQYNELLQGVIENAKFNYAYDLSIEYSYRADSLFMEKAVTKIKEQASEKYYYEQTILFEKLKEEEHE